jgi:putative GTP pyrophosphokinase
MPAMEEDFEREYGRRIGPLRLLAPKVEQLIIDLVQDDKDIRLHSVVSRIKSEDSCLRKLTRPGVTRPLSSLTDLLGLRIITYMRDDVDAVAKIVERQFRIDAENSVDKSAALDPDRFGYLSVHYIAEIGEPRVGLPEYRAYRGLQFEVQIRSILQHAWAEIEHDLGYKSEAAIPRTTRRRFSRLASLLELADDEFLAIRDELEKHQETATKVIRKGELDVEIDQDSLYSFAETDARLRRLETLLAKHMNVPYGRMAPRSWFGGHVRRLLSVGFATVADLSDFLDADPELQRAFVPQWQDVMSQAWDGQDQDGDGVADRYVPGGIGLYLLYLLKYGLMDAAGTPPDRATSMAMVIRAKLAAAQQQLGRRRPELPVRPARPPQG